VIIEENGPESTDAKTEDETIISADIESGSPD
jgi:hypothetical protein